MKQYLFLSIALLCLASCDKMDISDSQADSFIKFYNTFSILKGADVKQIPGKGYAMIGTVTTNSALDQICLIRTDKFGNSVDSAIYFGGPYNEKAYQVEVLDNGDMIILGSTMNSAGKKQPYLIRTDSLGHIQKELIIAATKDKEAYKLRLNASEDTMFMVGYEQVTRGTRINKDIWLGAVTINLALAWERPIGFDEDDEGYDLQLLGNEKKGKIFITGYTTTLGLVQAFALKAGRNGLGGSLFPLSAAAKELGNCIQVMDENNIVIAGTTWDTDASGSDMVMKKVTYSPTGIKTVWTKKFANSGDDVGKCIMLDGDKLHFLGTMASSGLNSSIALITTDLQGESYSYSTIGQGSQLQAEGFEMTEDNGFIIAATNRHSDNDISMTLIKLKPAGTLH